MPQDIEKELQFFSGENKEPAYDKEIVRRVIVLAELPKGAVVLDAGCGEGYWGRNFAGDGYRVTGIDLSEESIRLARKRAAKGQVFYTGNLLKKLPFAPESFDAIICGGMLHHFPDEDDLNIVLGNFVQCLKRNGKIILVEPNGSNPVVSLSRRFGQFLVRYYRDIATENETMHSVKTYIEVLKKNNFDISVVESCRHIVIGGFKRKDVIYFLSEGRRFLLKLVWKFFPEPYRGNEVVIIANLRTL